jgi:hypothetical protein
MIRQCQSNLAVVAETGVGAAIALLLLFSITVHKQTTLKANLK